MDNETFFASTHLITLFVTIVISNRFISRQSGNFSSIFHSMIGTKKIFFLVSLTSFLVSLFVIMPLIVSGFEQLPLIAILELILYPFYCSLLFIAILCCTQKRLSYSGFFKHMPIAIFLALFFGFLIHLLLHKMEITRPFSLFFIDLPPFFFCFKMIAYFTMPLILYQYAFQHQTYDPEG